MSTTKLTRKEIAADPIHDALIGAVEMMRARARLIASVAVGVVVVVVAVYFGMGYLESRDIRAQQQLAEGMDYYHGLIDVKATANPYEFGPTPVFASEEAKFQAASKAFSSVISQSSSSKPGIMARYYLGLCQIRLGQKDQAVASLEAVGRNTSDRTVAFLARKVLATYYVENGNAAKGQEMLESMLKDPQCDLPKEDLQIDLSRALMAQGKREEAVKILQDAQDTGGGGMLQSLIFQELSRIQKSPGATQ